MSGLGVPCPLGAFCLCLHFKTKKLFVSLEIKHWVEESGKSTNKEANELILMSWVNSKYYINLTQKASELGQLLTSKVVWKRDFKLM